MSRRDFVKGLVYGAGPRRALEILEAEPDIYRRLGVELDTENPWEAIGAIEISRKRVTSTAFEMLATRMYAAQPSVAPGDDGAPLELSAEATWREHVLGDYGD